MVKQVIVVRKDLDMPVGKTAAQVAHASVGAAFEAKDRWPAVFQQWLETGYTKVVVGVESEQALNDLLVFAEMQSMPTFKVVDEGRTVFNGVHTTTCAAFGPFESDRLDQVTGHLRLLR